jgi:hypothetical protein
MNLGRNPFTVSKIAWNAVRTGDSRFNRIQDRSARVCITDFQKVHTYDVETGRTGRGVFNTYLKYGSNDPDRACHFQFLIPGAGFEPAL